MRRAFPYEGGPRCARHLRSQARGPTASSGPACGHFWGFPQGLWETEALAVHFQASWECAACAPEAEIFGPPRTARSCTDQPLVPLKTSVDGRSHRDQPLDDRYLPLLQLQAHLGLGSYTMATAVMQADGEPLLAGRQTETEGDMGLCRFALLPSAMIFSRLDVFASRQLQNQHASCERCDCLEAKLSRLLTAWEPGLSDPPVDHAALTVDQFQARYFWGFRRGRRLRLDDSFAVHSPGYGVSWSWVRRSSKAPVRRSEPNNLRPLIERQVGRYPGSSLGGPLVRHAQGV